MSFFFWGYHESGLEEAQLGLGQWTRHASAESFQGQGSKPNPLKLANLDIIRFKHSADVTIFSLVNPNLVLGPGFRGKLLHGIGFQEIAFRLHTFFKRSDFRIGQEAFDGCHVDLFNLVSRMHQPIGQIAIVGNEQESFAVPVETAHGKNPFVKIREQIEIGGPPLRIVVGTDHVTRFIHQEVNERLGLYQLTVQAYLTYAGLNLDGGGLGKIPINRNPAICDKMFAGTPGSKAATSQVLV
jgi:hypothetical protein